jgi:putative aminopeptidase FrvX
MDIKETLKALCGAKGPPGYEDQVRGLVRQTWEPLTDALERGRMGDVVGIKRGAGPSPRPKIMLAGHMDEIALIVTKVEGDFLRVRSMAGMDRRVLPGQFVTVFGQRELPGVIGAVPPHLTPPDQRGKYPEIEDLVVDVGLPADELGELVRVGDVVTFDVPPTELQGGRLAAKSLDNRASLAAITVCLEELQSRAHVWDVLAVATTREEVGSHGARAVAFQYQPDVAVALDVTFGTQPGADEDVTFDLGGGPTLSLGPNFHPKLYAQIMKAADRLEMTVRPDPAWRVGGTDAVPLQVSRAGIPTALIGIPLRNMHTPVEVVDVKDAERAGRLLAGFIAGLEADFLQALEWRADEGEGEEGSA